MENAGIFANSLMKTHIHTLLYIFMSQLVETQVNLKVSFFSISVGCTCDLVAPPNRAIERRNPPRLTNGGKREGEEKERDTGR